MAKTKHIGQYRTILEGVDEMLPGVEALKKELLAGRKAKREGKPKRVAYHMRRVWNIIFNLDHHYWQPIFGWAQTESFFKEYRAKVRRRKARKA